MLALIHELKGSLRAREAADLREQLQHRLSEGDLVIVTHELEAVDAAIIQVLLSAGRTAARLNRTLQIDCPEGGALARMADRLSLRSALSGRQGGAIPPRSAQTTTEVEIEHE
jgi:hypothetical protein